LLQALAEQPRQRADELARRLQVPIGVARYTISRMMAARQVAVVEMQRHASGGRPAFVYAPAESATTIDDARPAWFR
jgi:predicted ArsR family transcriptional regulator